MAVLLNPIVPSQGNTGRTILADSHISNTKDTFSEEAISGRQQVSTDKCSPGLELYDNTVWTTVVAYEMQSS